ncbi:MAG: LacI family DNA-binding transcriptional regulator [Lentisphaeria bacterium]|nr:LacI family DNA-binding transcriptional regulator [Lentisphaeria bacterium]
MSVTLKDLAAASGLSIRSVRRALSGEPGVSQNAREKICTLASELGYVPNVAARDLRVGRTPFVGLLTSPSDSDVARRRTQDLIDRIGAIGLHTLAAVRPDTPTAMRELARKWSGMAGWIIFATPPNPEVEAVLPECGFSFVIIDGKKAAPNVIPLVIDRSPGIAEAITHLLSSGRKNIWRCGNLSGRKSGFEQAFRRKDRSIRHGTISPAGETFEDGFHIGPDILRTGADAVFFDVDRTALGFLRFAQKNNIRIPEDIAVVGFDDDQAGRFVTPPLATVAQPIAEINQAVLQLLETNQTNQTLFPTHLVLRESAQKKEDVK